MRRSEGRGGEEGGIDPRESPGGRQEKRWGKGKEEPAKSLVFGMYWIPHVTFLILSREPKPKDP